MRSGNENEFKKSTLDGVEIAARKNKGPKSKNRAK